ncbi:MAG: HIRAN domain-containing protein [Proteobacteria bacterium]|nr:HIRAN domain-containing protein [Pseudomonadota bacterium]MBU1389716.1 HIRAN domain-containing protein [Pseudomonadota bacterium]MBU1542654.1 HIRAN domain-containing protein [Pseudomonadota bacterium]MBU2480733.1 HIRAN domain-containing protein [Pseudomonadota bacterium]
MNPIITKLAGVSFGECQQNIKLFGNRDINSYCLKREPSNPYDSNAVWVGIGTYHLGYLPTAIAREIAPLIDAGRRFEAEYVSRNGSPYHDTVGLTVKILEI